MIRLAYHLDGLRIHPIGTRTGSVSVIQMETFWIGIKDVLAYPVGAAKITGITTVEMSTFRPALRFPIVARQRHPYLID